MEVRMDGRTALVTGASRGIGFAIAERFAQAGADVAIVARSAEKLAQARTRIGGPGRVVTIAADVSRAQDVERAVAEATAQLGPIDVLVNNAGSSARGSLLDVSDADWQADLDLKLFAAIRFSRLVIPGMKERRWGRIINVVNVGAKAPAPASTPTSVSRAAGIALTKSMAGEFGPHGILVNALAVGWILSDQWPRFHQREMPDTPYEEYLAIRGRSVPLGRIGTAGEFANVACFLASDAGSYVTGVCINVDGGRSPVV